MPTSHFPRGAVLKCRFPYDSNPHQPGPQPHYCLFAEETELADKRFVAVCYGTSRLDSALISAHEGFIFDVSSNFVRGAMPGPITHFIVDHVAVLPLDKFWVYLNFEARLDFMREEKRQNDMTRRRLYAQYEMLEPVLKDAAFDALDSFLTSGQVGLPPGKTLR